MFISHPVAFSIRMGLFSCSNTSLLGSQVSKTCPGQLPGRSINNPYGKSTLALPLSFPPLPPSSALRALKFPQQNHNSVLAVEHLPPV